jgi:formiminotetrahydrofolate cyclodeaminase
MKHGERSVAAFLDVVGSEAPAPGGGSVAALAGALAASLCAMACRLTLSRKKHAQVWPEIRGLLEQAEGHLAELRCLVDEDSEAYQGVMAARKLPHETAPESEARADAVRLATLMAAGVPLRTLQAVAELAAVAERLAVSGNPACITDTGTAAAMLRAAARSAAYNVCINLPDVADAGERDRLAGVVRAALDAVEAITGRVERAVLAHLEAGGAT